MIDLETTCLKAGEGNIVCVGYKFGNNNSEVCFDKVPVHVIDAIEDKDYLKIFHNACFDVSWLEYYGLNITYPVFDTMIAHYQRYPTKSHKLKDILKENYGVKVTRLKDLLGKGKNKIEIKDVNKDILKQYCIQDVEGTYKLYNDLKDIITDWTNNIEFNLIPCMIEINKRGFYIDKQKLNQLKFSLEQNINQYLSEFKEMNFNPNSPKQIRELLIQKGYSNDVSNYVTDKGQISTNKTSLKCISSKIPEVKNIVAYREKAKILNTYIRSMWDKDFLIGNFNLCGTWTGRISSSKPNLQNIPVRTAEGKEIRNCLIARPGYKLVIGDLSQIEPRLIAHYSKDRVLGNIFKNNGDFHSETTKMIYNKSEVNEHERFIGKTFGLATLYGASASRLRDTLISSNVDISFNEVNTLRSKILSIFKEVLEWANKKLRIGVINRKYIETIGKRLIPYEEDMNILNTLIQSSSADVMKLILYNVHGTGIPILATVHDELVCEIKEDKIDENKILIKHLMENSFKLKDIRIVSNVKVCNSWGDK